MSDEFEKVHLSMDWKEQKRKHGHGTLGRDLSPSSVEEDKYKEDYFDKPFSLDRGAPSAVPILALLTLVAINIFNALGSYSVIAGKGHTLSDKCFSYEVQYVGEVVTGYTDSPKYRFNLHCTLNDSDKYSETEIETTFHYSALNKSLLAKLHPFTIEHDRSKSSITRVLPIIASTMRNGVRTIVFHSDQANLDLISANEFKGLSLGVLNDAHTALISEIGLVVKLTDNRDTWSGL